MHVLFFLASEYLFLPPYPYFITRRRYDIASSPGKSPCSIVQAPAPPNVAFLQVHIDLRGGPSRKRGERPRTCYPGTTCPTQPKLRRLPQFPLRNCLLLVRDRPGVQSPRWVNMQLCLLTSEATDEVYFCTRSYQRRWKQSGWLSFFVGNDDGRRPKTNRGSSGIPQWAVDIEAAWIQFAIHISATNAVK